MNSLMQRLFLLSFFVSFCHAEDIQASEQTSELLNLPRELFFEKANHMTFSALKNFSLTSKKSKALVDDYFSYREGRVHGVRCPRSLPNDLIQKLINNTIPRGVGSFIEPQRAGNVHGVRPFLEIDGVKWSIIVEPHEQNKSLEFIRETIGYSAPTHLMGRKVSKECHYGPHNAMPHELLVIRVVDELM